MTPIPPSPPVARSLPELPEPDGCCTILDGRSVVLPLNQYKLHNSYLIFTSAQMRAYALAAISAHEAEVGRLKADAERFRWLAEGKSIHGGWMGSAPFVMSPNRSRLYAIHALRDEALRIEVDVDIYDNKADELHKANELVERSLLPEGVRRDTCDERYIDALYKLAQQELGWSDERAKACDAQLDPRNQEIKDPS